MKRQWDFSEKVIRTLCQFSGGVCSICGVTTGCGPGTIGVAAHICAAEAGGPRFEELPAQTARNSIENAIWLCANCHAEVDKLTGLRRFEHYTSEDLLKFKIERESTHSSAIGKLFYSESIQGLVGKIQEIHDAISSNHGADVQKDQGYSLKINTIPRPARHYIERSSLLAKIGEVLDAGNRDTLFGGQVQLWSAGGYGKSVLAYMYAAKASYPGGSYILNCGNCRPIEDALAYLLIITDESAAISTFERAQIVIGLLAEKRSLLVLDSLEDESQWQTYLDSSYLNIPNCDILITTRRTPFSGLESINVGQLTIAEMRQVLAHYLPSALEPQYDGAMKTIFKETGGLALVVAAIGVVRGLFDKSDNWNEYAEHLSNAKLHQLPTEDGGSYSFVASEILRDLQNRLHPAQTRLLEYAALLPQDNVRDFWLRILLEADSEDFGLDLGSDSSSKRLDPSWHISRLTEYDVLRLGDDNGLTWSVHRLHQKQVIESMQIAGSKLDERIRRLAGLSFELGKRGFDLGNSSFVAQALDLITQGSEFLAAIVASGLVSDELEFQIHGDLADSYSNRSWLLSMSQNYRDAESLLRLAVDIRQAILLKGRIDEESQTDNRNRLAQTYMDLGTVLEKSLEFQESLSCHQRSVAIRLELRNELEKSERWTYEQQRGLGMNFMNLGVAYLNCHEFLDRPEFLSLSVQELTKAVELQSVVLATATEKAEIQNDLAHSHMNRGLALGKIGNIVDALQDFQSAIDLRESLKGDQLLSNAWRPSDWIDLVKAHHYKGRLHLILANTRFDEKRTKEQEDHAYLAIGAQAIALNILNQLRFDLARTGRWQLQFQILLGNVLEQLADAHFLLDDFYTALAVFSESIEIQRQIRSELEPKEQWHLRLQLSYAVTLSNRAKCLTGLGRLSEAKTDQLEYDSLLERG